MGTMLDAAKEYIKQGISIFPLKYKDKKPALKSWKPYQERYATEEELVEWFKTDKMNIAIVTGKISGISVLDIDGPEALKLAKSKGLPETKLIKTGKPGGWHCYYQYEPRLRNWQARTDLPGIDVRSEGGYVVAPPSIHPDGPQYKCVKNIALGLIPPWILHNSVVNYNNSIYSNNKDSLQNLQTLQNLFEKGRRDNDLFHIANAMVKGGLEKEYIHKCLEIIINSWGENDPKWIKDKIESALNREERKNINIIGELKEFLDLTETYVTLTDIYQTLTNLTPHKNAVYQAIHRMVKEKYLEKHPSRHGTYRRIKKEFELMDFKSAAGETADIFLPLDMDDFVKLYPGNIILLAGSPNTGKTAFMLEFIRLNQWRHKILYMNSEMGEDELKKRLELFQDMPLENWQFDAMEISSNFHDPIDPEKYDLFVIDYLEMLDNFYEVGKFIAAIHKKLNNAVCLIGIQKKTDSDTGRGGEFSLEKPRLVLALDRGRIKVVKCKAWIKGHDNPNGKVMEFKLINGSKFLPETLWYPDTGKPGDRKLSCKRREDV